MSDSYFGNVSLLLNCNGTNGSTTFTDISYNPVTVTANGNAQVSTSSPQWGTGSALFDSVGDFLSFPTSTAFDFGSSDFTVEFWYKENGSNSAGDRVFQTRNGDIYAGLSCSYSDSTHIQLLYSLNGSSYTGTPITFTITSGWHHYAITRLGGTIEGWKDGVSVGSSTISGTLYYSGADSWVIGGQTTPDRSLAGYIDDFRVTKGVARYITTFDAPDEEFTSAPPATMDIALTSPSQTLSAYFGHYATLTAPTPAMAFYTGMSVTLSAPTGQMTCTFGAAVALTAPMGIATMTGHDASGENAADLTAPMGQVSASFGAFAKLSAPMGALAATGTVSGKITAALTAPMGVLAASGVGSPYSMTAQLRAPMGQMIGYSGAVAAIISPMGFVTSTGTTGGKMDAAIVAPLFELTATITRGQTMSAELIAPMLHPVASMQAYLIAPMGQLTAIGHAVVTATYEAYAINLKHNSDKAVDEVTRYTNFPFTKIVRYKNSYFGLGSDGNLYLLEGTTDAGTAIPWSFKTGITDFGSSFEKTVVSAYFRGRMGASEKVQLYAGEKAAKVYNYSNPRGAKAQNYRQKFGLGIKDTYYALGASGSGVMDLDAIETEIHEMTRRI